MTKPVSPESVALCVITPAWNCERWVARSLQSVQCQSYRNFRAVLIDDVSSDRTCEVARRAVAGDDRFTVVRNEARSYPLANLVKGATLAGGAPNDVIVVVDGDDWLAHDKVFECLAQIYSDPDIWLTYGSSKLYPQPLKARLRRRPLRGVEREYPDVVSQNGLWRYYQFIAGHLRTYRRFLWEAIPDDRLRDGNGSYFSRAGDAASMWAMLELATAAHVRYVPQVLYVYNNSHGQNESSPATVDNQILASLTARSKPRCAPLVR